MVGRGKKQAMNRKRTNLKMAIKKQKKLRKVAKPVEDDAPVEDVQMEEDDGKKKPLVKEGKIRRNALPLKDSMEGRRVTVKANAYTNVIHKQPISKKKFNKMQKAVKRVQKEKERLANEMQA